MNYLRLLISWLNRRRSLEGGEGSRSAANSPVSPPASTVSELVRPVRSTASLWIETGVVLILAVVPNLFRALMVSSAPDSQVPPPPTYTSLNILVYSLQIGVPVLYLIYRSGEAWSVFGLRRPRWLSDAVGGLLLFLCGYVMYRILYPLAWGTCVTLLGSSLEETAAAGLSRFLPAPVGWFAWLLVVLASCCNGFAEELVMRAYLIPRLERLLGGTWRSVACTAALFAAYHVYQGGPGVFYCAILGVLYGTLFSWIRRIWPLVVAHATADIVAWVVVASS